MDLPAAKVDKKQHVVRHEPAECPDLGGEEVGGHQHIHMRANKFLPRGRFLALWGWENAMASEDVAHRLVANRVAEMDQCTGDTIIAPAAVFLGHAHHQGFKTCID